MERRTGNAEQWFLELIGGSPPSGTARLLRPILRLISWAYRAGASCRNLLFDLGLKRSIRAPVPVISIGNLTTGGTGKTPTVALLVKMLKEAGHHPGIISRGYRELSEGGNDEAQVLEILCPGTPHIQNRDRVTAANDIATNHHCTVILADDAFQHRRLKRDLDIVLIDALNPWGHEALLPRGLLREPVSGLQRADVVALTRADLIDESSREAIWRIVKKNNSAAATVEVSFEPVGLVDKAGMSSAINDALAVHKSTDTGCNSGVLVFCGIGNPAGFQKTLVAANIPVQDLVTFPDHHHYCQSDLQELISNAENISATSLITTVKDLVKIKAEWVGNTPLLALDIRAKVTRNREQLTEALIKVMQQQTR